MAVCFSDRHLWPFKRPRTCNKQNIQETKILFPTNYAIVHDIVTVASYADANWDVECYWIDVNVDANNADDALVDVAC